MSPKLLPVSVDAREDKYLRGHCALSSVGEGYVQGLARSLNNPGQCDITMVHTGRYTPLSFTTIVSNGRQVNLKGLVTNTTGAIAPAPAEWWWVASSCRRVWRVLRSGHLPLILYSPVSWLLLLRMLRTDEALDPTVSTRSKPG